MSRFGVRWLIATLAGAVTVFVWGGLSHLVLLEGVGFSQIADEERIVSALRASLPRDGLYFLPSIDLKGTPTPAETAAWEARFRFTNAFLVAQAVDLIVGWALTGAVIARLLPSHQTWR